MQTVSSSLEGCSGPVTLLARRGSVHLPLQAGNRLSRKRKMRERRMALKTYAFVRSEEPTQVDPPAKTSAASLEAISAPVVVRENSS